MISFNIMWICDIIYTRWKSRRDVRRRRAAVRRKGNVRGKSIWALGGNICTIYELARALQLNAIRLSEKKKKNPARYNIILCYYIVSRPTLTFSCAYTRGHNIMVLGLLIPDFTTVILYTYTVRHLQYNIIL